MALTLSCSSAFQRANLPNKHFVKQGRFFKFDLNIPHTYRDKKMYYFKFLDIDNIKAVYHADLWGKNRFRGYEILQQNFAWQLEGKSPLGRQRRRWELILDLIWTNKMGRNCLVSSYSGTWQWFLQLREIWVYCYILTIKANKMHNFSNLFDKVLCTFRTDPLSIIRSISTLYTRNRYLSC